MDEKIIKLKYHGAEPQVRGQFHVLMAQQFGFKQAIPYVTDDNFDDIILNAKEYNSGIAIKINI